MSDAIGAALEKFEHKARARGCRQDKHGRLEIMGHARGYVMVRRSGAMPFVMTVKEWLALPEWKPDA